MKFARVKNEPALLLKYVKQGARIIDVGCGEGALVKFLVNSGFKAYGVDRKPVIKKSLKKSENRKLTGRLFSGRAEKIPFNDNTFDYAVYFASFHHIEPSRMLKALKESKRALRKNGKVIIVEPCPVKGHYYELLRLVNDEKRIQIAAYSLIRKFHQGYFRDFSEKYFYMNRTSEDYNALLEKYVKLKADRIRLMSIAGRKIKSRRYPDIMKSTVRVIVLSN